MSVSIDTARARAEAQFKKKEQQARDGEQARAEYDAQQQAMREKTARLRALRLARDAANIAALRGNAAFGAKRTLTEPRSQKADL